MKTQGRQFGVELSAAVWVGMSAFEVFCQSNDYQISQHEIDDFLLSLVLHFLHCDAETAVTNTSNMIADLFKRLDTKKIVLAAG